MVLRTIADLTGYDVSTISRVSNSKYIQTEFGVYPVKYFFLEKMQTQEGETIASNEVKIILDECIKSGYFAPCNDSRRDSRRISAYSCDEASDGNAEKQKATDQARRI